jgi:hypothetical protein
LRSGLSSTEWKGKLSASTTFVRKPNAPRYLACSVYESMKSAPSLSKCNYNIFGRSFDIEFVLTKDNTSVIAIGQVLLFEHALIFSYNDRITRKLAQEKY